MKTPVNTLIIALLFSLLGDVNSQSFKILHYTETSGYDHQTRSASFNMFVKLGLQNNFAVTNDSTGATFNDADRLKEFKIIVFANTTGDQILDRQQQLNFENYIASGGNVIGIHSATDTYRHSTANGLNTGAWDFYAETIGASVQQDPTHVDGTPNENNFHVTLHQLLNNIPNPWFKPEEYYYWQFGYFDSINNVILLKVDTTTGPNGMINSYDHPRATAWYKTMLSGSRIYYTSLGHAVSNYNSDSTFMQLIKNAVLWTSGLTSVVSEPEPLNNLINIYPNPFQNKFNIELTHVEEFNTGAYYIFDLMGKPVETGNISSLKKEINLGSLPEGMYYFMLKINNRQSGHKIICIH